jgi:hypothetical protein
MHERPVYSGLCADCQNAPKCTFPRIPGRPVRHCEEFKGNESAADRNYSCEGTFPLCSGFDSEAVDYRARLGLCANCANREACTFPKPEGGVWHCEEYR